LHTAAVRRLTKDEHLSHEFATTWPQYDLDQKTHALLAYAKKLTQEPSMVEDADIEELRTAGWGEQAIHEATALISVFNFTGRMEAASGLPMDQIPEGVQFPESTPGKPTVSARV
jgi:alkylhydroperoxidase family enzyme